MKFPALLSAFFLFVLAPCLHAQLVWKPIPFDKPISGFSLGIDGNIYAITSLYQDSSAVFITFDSGATWSKVFDSPWISGVTCDSNGAVVVISNGEAHLSLDSGHTWQPFGGPYILQIQSAVNGLYETEEGGTLNFTNDYGVHWNTLAFDGMIDDWAGIYCGSGNRLIATESFSSGWMTFGLPPDTPMDAQCIYTDNSPPGNIVFGGDGYIFAANMCGLVRLSPGRGQWEIYDTIRTHTGIVYLPLASPNAQSIIYLDTNGTYASTDHGDSWQIIGSGIPMQYAGDVTVAFDRNGTGYALSDGRLYTTSYFKSSVATAIPARPISLFPVPCTTSLTVQAADVERIKIFDLLGVLRMNAEYRSRQANPVLDVSALPAGIYALEIISANSIIMARMVKD